MEIARSYSKTVQISQFEPIKSFASIKIEIEDNLTEFEIKQKSKKIYDLCKEIVASDIENEIKEKNNK